MQQEKPPSLSSLHVSRRAVYRFGRRAHMSLGAVAAIALAACGGGDGGGGSSSQPQPEPVATCTETGPYACKSGETEPLYTFQWALNYARSWFTDHADAGAYGGGIDLNVEPVHRQGIKGQGVNVLVLDTGVDLGHEDLRDNADYSLSWNFETNTRDPSPMLTSQRVAHGTNVAGIIGAAQNGKGIMGIAPLVKLGGGALVFENTEVMNTVQTWLDSYGGAEWSRKAHIINGSFGGAGGVQAYSLPEKPWLANIRGLKALRDGKGIVYVKAAGNDFDAWGACGALTYAYNCVNPANDSDALEPNVIITAALNAKGQASSYSSSGSVVWITGMGGEGGKLGTYGEVSGRTAAEIAAGATGDGPQIFSTDIRGCSEGYSQKVIAPGLPDTPFLRGESELVPGVKDNPNCDYDYMNGTSSASPTIAGVVALMLSANPDLTWRDVRDILRLSARTVDRRYEQRTRDDLKTSLRLPYNARFDLTSNSFVNESGDKRDITSGATKVPVELGWVTNGAGLMHSNWYGFGVPDAAKAVELAQLYRKEPSRSRSAAQIIPPFVPLDEPPGFQFQYQKVNLVSEHNNSSDSIVDELQVRLTGMNLCLGSIGIAVQSPAGTVSWLKMPLDHFAANGDQSSFDQYGLGSYAFYGESAKGTWKFYVVASNPLLNPAEWGGRQAACTAAPADGLNPVNAGMLLEARVIAQ